MTPRRRSRTVADRIRRTGGLRRFFAGRSGPCGLAAILAAGLLALALAGCVGPPSVQSRRAPAPQAAALPPPAPGALLSSPQTPPSPEVERAARSIPPGTDVERLLAAMRYVGEHLAYDPSANPAQNRRAAGQLFVERNLGSCSEFALADLALCRALGYRARLVLTVDARWLERNRRNPLSIPYGHVLVEVWAGGRWLLLDPTAFTVSDCGGRDTPCLPDNAVVLTRAEDNWAAGMTDVDSANVLMRGKAAAFTGVYEKPECTLLGRAVFDYAGSFAAQGEYFLERGNLGLARRLFRKSLEFDPNGVTALVGLARCQAARGETTGARELLLRALAKAPNDVRAAEALARLDAAPDAKALPANALGSAAAGAQPAPPAGPARP